jgi:hypothetical protein
MQRTSGCKRCGARVQGLELLATSLSIKASFHDLLSLPSQSVMNQKTTEGAICHNGDSVKADDGELWNAAATSCTLILCLKKSMLKQGEGWRNAVEHLSNETEEV